MKNIAIFANLALIAFTIFLYFDKDTLTTQEGFTLAAFIVVPILIIMIIISTDKKREQ